MTIPLAELHIAFMLKSWLGDDSWAIKWTGRKIMSSFSLNFHVTF